MQLKTILALAIAVSPVFAAEVLDTQTRDIGSKFTERETFGNALGSSPAGFTKKKREDKEAVGTNDIDVINHLAKRVLLTCTPTTNESGNRFTVQETTAEAQAKAAGYTKGKSGYPHTFQNIDGIDWEVAECDAQPRSEESKLKEYPIYWTSSTTKAWTKDKKKNAVGYNPKTPMRVVYMEGDDDELIFCGVMIHEEVLASNQGDKRFVKCT
ncbi:hypothetical protein BO70DRAFT_395841 [Aspergillus heteromorphus CBS 117.55]|uniref:Uncharacterized protein n=1 Tax=Aspergillus heteromorphus CBS 117.55 TaxID=1448321 RepID=A0A317WBR9_9EURO|nr:uncharacterized protein BO70DRAFT_395841 [Aspergillus heteromorphus CBS 117.55]PWY83395.1 hypothetical protein BO70DRAFT_395841 [Aspergillus heteromorphus CBS 117.55]